MIYPILLAYNEEKNIGAAVRDVALALDGEEFQIVVVNDGSTDRTKEIVGSLAETCHAVMVSHERNRGVGQAFRTGLSYVAQRGKPEDVAITMEADGTSDCKALPELVRKIKGGVDVVCASRYCKGGGYHGFSWSRLLYSWGANGTLALLFPIRGVHDYTIFYRGYRLSAIQKAFGRYGDQLVTCRGFGANTEILVKLRPLGFRFEEVPLRYDYGRKKSPSRIRIVKTILEYLRLYWQGVILRQF